MASSPTTRVYSHENVDAAINTLPVSGFAEGDDCITVTWDTEKVTKTRGADGSVQFTRMVGNDATVTLKLHHTSPSNLDMQQAYEAFDRGGLLATLDISDGSTGDRYSAQNCAIQKQPDTQLGANAGVREWVILVGHLSLDNANLASVPEAPTDGVSQVDPSGYFNGNGGSYFG